VPFNAATKLPERTVVRPALKEISPDELIEACEKPVYVPPPVSGAGSPGRATASSIPPESRKIPCVTEPPVTPSLNTTFPESLI
jgi:hypothetical protein